MEAKKKLEPKTLPPRIPRMTDRQLVVLEAAWELIQRDVLNRAPTVRRLAAHIGRGITSTWEQLSSLKDLGLLEGDPHAARAYEVTDLGKRVLARAELNRKKAEEESNSARKDESLD